MYRLRNGVQNYSWGSPDAIPRFLGERPDGTPVAEVWIGTHPLQPSTAESATGETKALADLTGDLPFMLKVLAADQPLSLQVHPSKSQAEDGYAEEERAGIPLTTGDVTRESDVGDAIGRVVDETGRFDIAIHSAGVGLVKQITDVSEGEWDQVIDVNLKGNFNVLRSAGRIMTTQGRGAIVLFSSIRAVTKRPGFSSPSSLGPAASTMSARVSARTSGET